MATDALLALQASVTKTATFNGAGLQLVAGTPRWPLIAQVDYSAAANASGSNTVVFSIDVSRDGGTTYYTEFQADPITLSTTTQSGELDIPFSISPSSVANGYWIRLSATFAGSGTSPTITYSGAISLGRP